MGHCAPNFDDLSLSLNIIAIIKWKLTLESVEKVVSKTECPKLFQPGLNYHNLGFADEKITTRSPQPQGTLGVFGPFLGSNQKFLKIKKRYLKEDIQYDSVMKELSL